MDLFNSGKPYKLFVPDYGERISDDIFKVQGGICYFEIGWNDTTLNPLHVIEGELTGAAENGPWVIADVRIRELTTDDPEWQHYQEWKKVKPADAETILINAMEADGVTRA